MSLRSIASACSPPFLRPAFERIENSPIGARLATGMFWSMAGGVISRGLMLIATVLVARMLGKTVYGELGMIQSTVGMFGVFAGFGLGVTATKHVAEFKQSDPHRAGRILGLSGLVATGTGSLMALGLFFFAPWVAAQTLNAAHLADVLRIGALVLFINALNGAQTGALSGFEAFKTIAYVNVFVGLISLPLLVCGAWFGGLTGAVWALAINLAFNWLLNHLALRQQARRYKVPFTLKQCSREWPVLWKFSVPLFLAGAVGGPANWVCNALLVNQPDGYAEMGVFSAASQWLTLLLFIPGLLSKVVLPILSQQLGQNDARQSRKTLVLAVKVNLLVVVPVVVAASIASPYIMSLYGEEFRDGWPVLIAVVLTAGILSAQIPVAEIMTASGRMWVWFAISLGWAISYIALSVLLIHFGALGLAAARAIAFGLQAGVMLAFAIWFFRKRGQDAPETAEPGEQVDTCVSSQLEPE